MHALLGDPAKLGEGKHLKSAAVGENGAVPAGEFVQSAERVDIFVAGAQVEMVGIAELHLTVQVFEVIGRDRAADGAGRGDIHKSGHVHRAVDGVKIAQTRASLLFDKLVQIRSSLQ